MEESILNSVKKVLGLDAEYDAFDIDVMMHTNSALSKLESLGVGPEGGFMITGPEETWSDFIGSDPRYNSVKTYVYLNVKLIFDPPATSFATNAFEEQIKELGWRLNVTREGDNRSTPVENPPQILDGGAP